MKRFISRKFAFSDGVLAFEEASLGRPGGVKIQIEVATAPVPRRQSARLDVAVSADAWSAPTLRPNHTGKTMASPILPAVPARYLARVRELLKDGRRKLLGLVGPPGAGKSTLALALHHAFPEVSQVVPMDGHHLANVELQRLGRAGRKGAPDTFDSAGYAAMLQRLRQQRLDEIVYAPEFRREIEEPVAGAIPVFPQTRLVITEGNYLLLNSGHWASVAALLDDVWYVDVDDALRTDRLTQRHEQFGRNRQDAMDWVAGTDEPNARLIATTRSNARLVFRWDDTATD